MPDVSSYLSSLIEQALDRRASDIHIEPLSDQTQIRMRIDGELLSIDRRSEALGPPLTSKLKLLANLDIGERRIPQDGVFSYRLDGDEQIDIRVSTLPTIHGEKLALRLLQKNLPFQSVSSLGFDSAQCHLIEKTLHSTEGLLLATGPTGSGKTTTIHTLIQEILRRKNCNIITLEDPVEYEVPGVNQAQVNVKAGLTFTTGLRAILRQDPDVIYVGEIRDRETVEIAIRAALTGRLVLSTLHTTDAAGTIARLLDMGIAPYLLTSALKAVISQRLIRRVCHCRADPCPLCRDSGYYGRQAIFEVLPIQDDLHPLILSRATLPEIRSYLRRTGFRSINMRLREKAREGVTSLREYQRVLISDADS